MSVRSDGVVVADDRLRGLERQSGKTEKAIDRLIRQTDRLGKSLTSFGRSLSLRVTAPIVAMGLAAVMSASDFESSFADIRKTVNATEKEFAVMSREIRDLSKQVPTTVNELNRLGGVAGQLGVESKNIVAFTRTIAMLGDTTDIAGEQAALSISRFMNIMGTAQRNIDRVGSTIVGLGNNFAAMESEIVDIGTSLASFGRQMRLSEPQVLAFAAAIAASGGESAAASTAFQKAASTMQRAVIEMNEDLVVFADTAGVSVGKFSRLFREDAAGALVEFLAGLNRISERGESVGAVLEKLGLADQRLQREFGKVAGNLDQLVSAIALADAAWESNTALTEEALKRYETFKSQMLILKNTINDLGITIGNDLIPHIIRLNDWLKGIISSIDSASSETRTLVIKVAAVAAVVGPAVIVLGLFVSSLAAIGKAAVLLTPFLGSMAVAIAAIGAFIGLIAVEIERRFVPGMEDIGRTGQILNVLIRAWVVLREVALAAGEAIFGIGTAIVGIIQGITAPIAAIVHSMVTALDELRKGNLKAAATALSASSQFAVMNQIMAEAEEKVRNGLGFSAESLGERISKAMSEVTELRDEVVDAGKASKKATTEISTGFQATNSFLKNTNAIMKEIGLGMENLLEISSDENFNFFEHKGVEQRITDQEKLIELMRDEKAALEGGSKAWKAYERALFQTQKVEELNKTALEGGTKATQAQIEIVRELAGAIFDLQNASEGLDLERSFSKFFEELSSNGDDAFKNLAESFRLSFIEGATSSLFDMIEDFGDEFVKGFEDVGPEIAVVLQAALVAGIEGSDRAIASAVGAAIGAAVGGKEGAQIGAFIGDLIGSTFSGGTPSGNAGLLLGNPPGVSSDRKFGGFDLFGQQAQVFARRDDQDAAIAASRQFITLEETIAKTLSGVGLELDQFRISLVGLDENAQGTGAFLGQAVEDGEAVGQSVAMQLLSVARQAIRQIAEQDAGLIPPEVLEQILFPKGAATVVGDVTNALQEFFLTVDQSDLMSGFVEKFASDEQKFKIVSDKIAAAFASVGLVVPKTREELLALVNALDHSTEAGHKQITTLLNIADLADNYYTFVEKQEEERLQAIIKSTSAMREFTDSAVSFFEEADSGIRNLASSIASDIATLTGSVTASISDSVSAQLAYLEGLRQKALLDHAEQIRQEQALHNTRINLAKSLMQYAQNLRTGALSPLANAERFALAQQNFRSTLSSTLAGDVDAAAKLQESAGTFSELSRFMFASSPTHTANMDEILAGLDQAAGLLGSSEFNPQAANDLLLEQLRLINEQLEKLPDDFSRKLAPVIFGAITQLLAQGKTPTQVANVIKGLGDTAIAATEIAIPGFIKNNATTAEQATAEFKKIQELGLSPLDTVRAVAEAAKAANLTAEQAGDLLGFSREEVARNLALAGIPAFSSGGPVESTGPILAHGGEHVITSDRSNLVVNVNQKGIEELRELLREIRDQNRRYQDQDLKDSGAIKRAITEQAESSRRRQK
jgi:TP901 family phage tail tape measure protein